MAERYKRRRLIVSKMQYRLVAGNFLYLLTLILVFVGAILTPMVVSLENESLSGAYRDDAARRLLTMQDWVWVAVPLIVAFCLIHSVVVSHRIAGPLYRFGQVFRDLASGNLAVDVRIRRADYLHREAAQMSRMIQALAAKMERIHESFGETSRTLPLLEQALGRRDVKEAAVLCGKLGSELDRLGRRIRCFRIRSADPTDPSEEIQTADRLIPSHLEG